VSSWLEVGIYDEGEDKRSNKRELLPVNAEPRHVSCGSGPRGGRDSLCKVERATLLIHDQQQIRQIYLRLLILLRYPPRANV